MPKCKRALKDLYTILSRSKNPIITKMMAGVLMQDTLAFRVLFGPGAEGLAGISVCVPLDAMENKGSRPRRFECALVAPNGTLTFIEGLGYAEPKKFFADATADDPYLSVCQEIEAELLRLLPYAQGKKAIPDTEPESESEG